MTTITCTNPDCKKFVRARQHREHYRTVAQCAFCGADVQRLDEVAP